MSPLPQPVELPLDERTSALPLRTQLVRFVLTGGLSDPGRNVSNSKPDTSVIGWIGRGAVHQPDMMERHLARPQRQCYRLCRIHFDLDFLAPGQKIVLVKSISMRNLIYIFFFKVQFILVQVPTPAFYSNRYIQR